MSSSTMVNKKQPPWIQAILPKLDQLKQFWQQLNPRARRLWLIICVAISLCLLWLIALAPALNTLRNAPDLHRQLDTQIENMQRISAEAISLQKQPKLSLDDAQKALQNTVSQRLGGTGQISITGNRAMLTLKNANPQSLAEFLTEARINARAIPQEVKITRSNAPTTGWDGSMTLTLPAK